MTISSNWFHYLCAKPTSLTAQKLLSIDPALLFVNLVLIGYQSVTCKSLSVTMSLLTKITVSAIQLKDEVLRCNERS
jgi:hypothetical protein